MNRCVVASKNTCIVEESLQGDRLIEIKGCLGENLEQNLSDRIANELRRDILRGNLRPGETVKERDHAVRLGVSRTPMREAIRLLANEGLLQLRPSRSPVVTNQSFKEISDQIQVLVILEKFSADLVCANASDEDLMNIQKIADRMAAEFDTTDALDMFEIDMSFHMAVVRASHNEALYETHKAYLARLWRARYLAAVQRRNRQCLVDEHGAIVEALHARSVEGTKNAIQTHLGNLKEDVIFALELEAKENAENANATG